ERARVVVNDGMDIIGGKGICLGPSNFLGRAYQQIPVGITVEGANILTRSLFIFGQGAIRCNPYGLRDMSAVQERDQKVALDKFDEALFGHIGFAVRNGFRSLISGLFGAGILGVKAGHSSQMRPYYGQITRLSSALALSADVSMLVL